MGEELKHLISEVNRMNDLMMFTENKQIINESIASVLKSLRLLVKNSLDDIAKFGIKEIDNIVSSMLSSKSTDEFFELLDNIKLHDEGVAKQLRRDIFVILPEVTQNRIVSIVNRIEGSIDSIPEDKIDDLLNDIINEQFPNEPESVRLFLKDTLSDSSSTISNKASGAKIASSIDDLIKKISKEGDSVEGHIDNIPNLTNEERSIMKRTWKTFWLKKESFYDEVRRKAALGGKESAQLARESDEVIERLSRAANNPSETITNQKAIDAYNKAISTNVFNSLPKWIRGVLISGLLTEGKSLSLGFSMIALASGLITFGLDSTEEVLSSKTQQAKDVSVGGVSELSKKNESKIKKALSKLDSSLFKDVDMGELKDGYIINYAKDGKSLSVYDSEYNVIDTYTIDEINKELKSN